MPDDVRRATPVGPAGATSSGPAPFMSMDYGPSNSGAVGDLVRGDVLIEGKRILAIGPSLSAGGAAVIDARGKIVMPGFIDTHHHPAWTAIEARFPTAS